MARSIWLVFFTDSLQQQISASLLPYVTSSFGFHGLLATTSIISVIVAGVAKLPLARILDVIGRNEGLIIMLTITVICKCLFALSQRQIENADRVLLSFDSDGRLRQYPNLRRWTGLFLDRHEWNQLRVASFHCRH